jgi:hypothetical protein
MTSYIIDTYQIYIKSNIVKIVSEDCRTFQIELDNPQEIFSNKDIIIEESSNKLIINIGSRKIYIPEIINDFDFGDIQISSLKKIINDMNKTMLLMNDKIKELENKVDNYEKLADHIFFEGSLLPVSINIEKLTLVIKETIYMSDYDINNKSICDYGDNQNLNKNTGSDKYYNIMITNGNYRSLINIKINVIFCKNINNVLFLQNIKKLELFNMIDIYSNEISNTKYIHICPCSSRNSYAIACGRTPDKGIIKNLENIKYLENLEEIIFNRFCDCNFINVDFSNNKLYKLKTITFDNSTFENLQNLSFLNNFKLLNKLIFMNFNNNIITYNFDNIEKNFNFLLNFKNYIEIIITFDWATHLEYGGKNPMIHGDFMQEPNNLITKINIKYNNTPDKNKSLC